MGKVEGTAGGEAISPRASPPVPGRWEPTEESVCVCAAGPVEKQDSTRGSEGPVRRSSEGRRAGRHLSVTLAS